VAPGRRAWGRLLVTGVLLQTTQFGGLYLGLAHGVPAGLAALVISASPLAVAALGVPLFGERLRGRQWLGLGLGLAGVGSAVASELSGSMATAGALAVVLGLGGFTAGTLWQKGVGAGMDLRTGTAVQLLGATVTTAPLTALHGGFAVPLTAAAVAPILWLAVVCSVGAFVLLFVLLRRGTGGAATSYLFLVPPLTSLLAVPLLGQPLSPGAIAGIAIAALGVALVTRTSGPTPARPAPARPSTP
jgi:drug/metabolite transporter (DMT)-like permease